jgi:hypothetical protein
MEKALRLMRVPRRCGSWLTTMADSDAVPRPTPTLQKTWATTVNATVAAEGSPGPEEAGSSDLFDGTGADPTRGL